MVDGRWYLINGRGYLITFGIKDKHIENGDFRRL